jgi:hypothetical protein
MGESIREIRRPEGTPFKGHYFFAKPSLAGFVEIVLRCMQQNKKRCVLIL